MGPSLGEGALVLKTRNQKIIAGIVLAFVIYAVYNDPDKSADVVHSAWDLVRDGITQIFAFFDKVIGS